jgi:hypothetical protein
LLLGVGWTPRAAPPASAQGAPGCRSRSTVAAPSPRVERCSWSAAMPAPSLLCVTSWIHCHPVDSLSPRRSILTPSVHIARQSVRVHGQPRGAGPSSLVDRWPTRGYREEGRLPGDHQRWICCYESIVSPPEARGAQAAMTRTRMLRLAHWHARRVALDAI